MNARKMALSFVDAIDRKDLPGLVALLGFAEGIFGQNGVLKKKNHWRVPAAWRIIVSEEGVAVWQLCVNPEPMRKILERIGTLRPPFAGSASKRGAILGEAVYKSFWGSTAAVARWSWSGHGNGGAELEKQITRFKEM